MRTGIIFWLLVAGYMLAGAASVINLLYGKEGFVKIGKYLWDRVIILLILAIYFWFSLREFLSNFFKRQKFVVINGFIEDAYPIWESPDIYCVVIKGISNNKKYFVSMKSENFCHYKTFFQSKGNKNMHYKIQCRKKFFLDKEFVKII